MEYKDYYKIMGLAKEATPEEIKRAYRRLARKYHPDVSKEPNAEAKFKELGEAYEVLKDPKKRAAYDQIGQNWQEGQRFTPPPDWAPDFGFGGGFTGAHGSGFSDFFEALFGGGLVRASAIFSRPCSAAVSDPAKPVAPVRNFMRTAGISMPGFRSIWRMPIREENT